MATLRASFEFLQWQPSYEKEKPYEVFIPVASFGDRTVPRSNLVFETRAVDIRDARGHEDDFRLDTHGFQFVKCPTAVRSLKDRQAVVERYIPEMEAFLQERLSADEGGKKVRTFCFDLRLRESIDPDEFAKKTVNLEDGFDALLPATHPHIDQSTRGAMLRVRRHMGDEADELLKGRVRVINLWRALGPVKSWPLALCDARTLKADDLVTADIVRRRYVGETYFGRYSTDHEWHYLSGMDFDDVILLKVFDSDPTVEGKRCLHSSFPLEGVGHEVQRESIEIRMLVFTES